MMDQQQAQQFGGMIAGMMGIFMFIGVAALAFGIFLFWRIFTKAGMAGPLSLLILVPGIGYIVVLCILAFSDWRVIPAPAAQLYPPNYPPPPSFPSTTPPSTFPPQS
ncbi:hypothetical protein [Granulicella mallensis]|nr:hypothetical protein [Granulicella mallensis]